MKRDDNDMCTIKTKALVVKSRSGKRFIVLESLPKQSIMKYCCTARAQAKQKHAGNVKYRLIIHSKKPSSVNGPLDLHWRPSLNSRSRASS